MKFQILEMFSDYNIVGGIVCMFQNVCYIKFQISEQFSDYNIVGAAQKMRANTASLFHLPIAF
jgi:hypothetical protein